MPPKRKPAEPESSSNPNIVSLGRPEGLEPTAQPAPPKRQRVSRACDQCRAARERCDGKQPYCYPCISQSRPCTYEVSPRKRGVQTGYIRTLELALGLVFEKVPGSEETLGTLVGRDGHQGHLILAGKDPLGAERLQKRWRKSKVHRGIDRILSGETLSSSVQGHGGLSPSADASDIEANVPPARNNPASVAPDTETVAQETLSSRRMSSAHFLPVTPSNESLGNTRSPAMPMVGVFRFSQALPEHLKLPANHWRLLDIYFSYTHSWLPILQKQDLFQASYLYPDQGLAINPKNAASAVHAELWAALALASVQDAASSKPSPSDSADPASPFPAEVYDIARALLPSEHGPFQVHHARAFLLLGLVNLGQDKLSAAALLTGSAIRILLNPNTLQHGTQDRDGSRFKLTLMSCFLIDTILAVRCNQPPHLKANDLAALTLVSENGADQWEPWTPCDGFGIGNAGSRSSRSSAFCLSTFNLLFVIMKVVSGEMAGRRQPTFSSETSSTFVAELQHVVNGNLQFGSFIVSPTCGNASVPTPYVARVTYLWARALAEPQSEMLLELLHDTLEQYQRIFGRCGTPPFLSACIASFANDEYLLRCSEQSRQVLRRLVSTYSPRRLEDRQPCSVRNSPPDPLFRTAQNAPEPLSSNRLSDSSNTQLSYPSPVIPSLYNSSTRTQHPQPQATNREYEAFLAPNMANMAGSYDHRYFANPLSATVPTGGNNMHMPRHPGTGMAAAIPDYDALLADLASIESTDALEVDPQFMTNLGFAPGCDITEILTRDFGAA
ncbi:hypothetical protein N657DRAFT_571405 [Parathielavia appendiculata]|uniref:Zn(2)-C6 fungal-type domain-containing protein n=1 Tax=Parathielavia appendiculata TaxID=2587402 RepID=A0AAN6Z4V1_9PEZI|nr:hypothetical protein N657DRAFT_571405 [Parathielavia appendiculata]